MHDAARDNNLAAAKQLIANGAGVDAEDTAGATPLHYAAWVNAVSVAKLLLEHGADVNAENRVGRTPLDETNYAEMRALLREHGAE